jgi:cyclophilin family peptidyl-prolyl cis-trans isomerase
MLASATWLNACKSSPDAAPAATDSKAAAADTTKAADTKAAAPAASATADASKPAAAAPAPAAAPAEKPAPPMGKDKFATTQSPAPAPAPAAPAAKPAPAAPAPAMPMADTMYAVIQTNKGNIVLELDHKNAPASVENFLAYANSNFYNGTVFHRVIRDFMIQGGGFTTDGTQKATNAPIKNEGTNGLANNRGTIAMARTNDPNSATSQFFINTVDNPALNTRNGRPGYAVFGKVVDGMEVVDVIRAVPTTRKQMTTPQGPAPFADVPAETVEIIAIKPLPGPPAKK